MNPDYATEVTLQPIDRYGLDAAILFSDILTVPDAMGLGLHFVAGEGPVFDHPVQSEEAVAKLYVPESDKELRYVMDAVTSIRKALNNRVPLIGFSGSPFTLACYMIEGRGSRDFRTVKTMMYQRPDLLERVLDVNAKAVATYLTPRSPQALRPFRFSTPGAACSPTATSSASLCATPARCSTASFAKTRARLFRPSSSRRAAANGSPNRGLRLQCGRPRLDGQHDPCTSRR